MLAASELAAKRIIRAGGIIDHNSQKGSGVLDLATKDFDWQRRKAAVRRRTAALRTTRSGRLPRRAHRSDAETFSHVVELHN